MDTNLVRNGYYAAYNKATKDKNAEKVMPSKGLLSPNSPRRNNKNKNEYDPTDYITDVMKLMATKIREKKNG